jgi:hypothetical protein
MTAFCQAKLAVRGLDVEQVSDSGYYKNLSGNFAGVFFEKKKGVAEKENPASCK